jgi:hypothetical protein
MIKPNNKTKREAITAIILVSFLELTNKLACDAMKIITKAM